MTEKSLIIGLALAMSFTNGVSGNEPKRVTSADKVKATAIATKPDADSKQKVTITLEIDKGWWLYANPVNHNNEFLDANQTHVMTKANEGVEIKVMYPAGRRDRLDKEELSIYEGTVKIEVLVTRAKNDTSPLELKVYVHAHNERLTVCLLPGTIKLMVK